MPFHTIQYLNEQGILSLDNPPPRPLLLKVYQTMLLTRLVDERMITLQRQGLITFCMSSLGEEAAAVASAAALDLSDWMYPQYRELGVMFWRGWTPLQYIHHMFGDAEDLILGRQMPNHFGDVRLNVVPVSSPIGTKIPHAAGCAYAMKLQGEASIAICYFGEGATSEGDFHAGLNFAAVRRCPVIFFCRNNGYAISTPVSAQFASEGVAPKGAAYGIRAVRVDGNDPIAVYEVVKEAKGYCLAEQKPVLIEAMTYRAGAHSSSDDPTRYRGEGEEWRSRCPILRLKTYLGLSDEEEKATIEAFRREIDQAVEIAKATPPPAVETLVRDVYREVPKNLNEELKWLS